MRKRCKYITILIFLAFISSCKKESFDLETILPEMIGTWEWNYSYIPESDLEFSEIESDYFMTINKNGKIEFYQDDLIVDVYFLNDVSDLGTPYSFRNGLFYYYWFKTDNINVNEFGRRKVFSFLMPSSKDTLILEGHYPFVTEQLQDYSDATEYGVFNYYVKK